MRVLRFLPLLIGLLLLVACTQNQDNDAREPTPTVPEATLTATATEPIATPTQPGSPVPPTATFPPTLTPSPSPLPPTETGTATPQPTPGPFEYTVTEQDSDCISILAKHGHRTPDQLQEFYTLNNMTFCAISPGMTVLVPRPRIPGVDPNAITPTVTPPVALGVGQSIVAYGQYCAVEGDTLTSIALRNNMTLKQVCELNPLPGGIDCTGCDFSQSSTGICTRRPLIGLNQCVTVFAPTPSPMPTQPPSGDETATPTPTVRAPVVVSPVNGASVSGNVRLQWVSSGQLQADQFYVVYVTNETTDAFYLKESKAPYLDLPADFLQATGLPQEVVWYVAVQSRTPDGLFVPSGGQTAQYRFTWQ